MGGERHSSKGGGGYVGGFLHLFDWNAKSRKKLFTNNSDLPEQSKQKKINDGNFPMTRLHLMDQDDSVAGSSIKGSGDYSCASSVTDEDYGASKAPGVVAKLMGLDSLPTSNFSDAYSTPFFGSQSLRDAHYPKKNPEFHHDHQTMFSGSLLSREEDPIRSKIEPKPQKILSRSIEKFQTETLPPKSAKSIPITHHRLLSPMKSTGFVPSKDALQIMEAAAKIIESGQQVSTKAKLLHVGSSAPLKVRDLKEKVEASKRPSKPVETSRKPTESISAKRIKEPSMTSNWNGLVDTKSFSVSSDVGESSVTSVGIKSKGKSVSLAVQAKVNVQKREGLTSNGSRNAFGQKYQSEFMSSQPFKSQPSTQRSSQKKSSINNATSVLRKNNQKQNCLAESGKIPSKSLPSTNSQGQKALSGDSSLGRQRNSSKNSGNAKVGSRKMVFEATDYGKDVTYSGATFTSKKRCVDGDFQFQNNQSVSIIDKNVKAIQSSRLMDNQFSSWAEDSKRNGMDVVSFTFTAPMTRSIPAPETSTQVIDNNNAFADFEGKKVVFNSGSQSGSRFSSVGRNVIGGDALSSLLEQKLKELTLGIQSSHNKANAVGSAASKFKGFKADLGAVMTSPELAKESKKGSHIYNMDYQWGTVFSSTNYDGLARKHKPQGVEEMYDCGSSNDSDVRNVLDCRHPSPISILEPYVFTESCNSSDTADSNSTEGNKHCSSIQAQDNCDIRSSKKFHLMEADTELSDSASSSSTKTMASKTLSLAVSETSVSTKWELAYVKKITCNAETMFEDLASGHSREITSPGLFDQIKCHENEPKLQRKVLFDCVGECLDLRWSQHVGGGYRAWEKGLSMVRRKERLAEEVYKEISGWEAMGNCMVDELVDKDMSSQYGKWLEFDAEAFELGIEIEGRILNSLINEVIADILVL